ncbi:sulfurtransferase [Haloferula helveola]|uniref:Sulfurtransferase n=1 Tax=Haloferula helveola TaxID=490095 RepID=A0ABN6H8W2_9BACT|nr:sulfurtransferase [Haloferula helveola]
MKIQPKQLKDEIEQGGVTLIDVRTPAEFGEVHIEGSQLMPLDRLKADEVKGDSCVLVCRSGKRAAQAKEKLESAGCGNLRVLEGGVTAWEAAGLPVNRGKAVLSLERQVRITAGVLVLIGVILGTWVHAGFYGLAAFVGAGLTFAGITDWCGMAMLLAKAPWNQRGSHCGDSTACSV